MRECRTVCEEASSVIPAIPGVELLVGEKQDDEPGGDWLNREAIWKLAVADEHDEVVLLERRV